MNSKHRKQRKKMEMPLSWINIQGHIAKESKRHADMKKKMKSTALKTNEDLLKTVVVVKTNKVSPGTPMSDLERSARLFLLGS
ncbi:hypothetical protein BDD14_0709 [Edaphobacter modestus]|uniref:Uncharacterized protein n=1 Tax=Edaphobacter modestus TaxID=388466 RepID=A0A4Q7YPI1_9BACT|nr:hypothetical protein BDD14_0709 [Edaphobacter modestus]